MILFILILNGCQRVVVSTPKKFYIPPDELEVLETNAEQGDIKAARKVAQYYTFTDYNIKKTNKYLKIIAKTGGPVDQYNLAFNLLLSSNNFEERNEGVDWLRISAKSGELSAQNYLAKLYETGDVVEQNYHNAKYWYEKGALKGDSFSIVKLADFHLEGKGCDKNRIKAYAFLSISQLYIIKESGYFRFVENKKKGIGLSKCEKKQAEIEFKRLKVIYPVWSKK